MKNNFVLLLFNWVIVNEIIEELRDSNLWTLEESIVMINVGKVEKTLKSSKVRLSDHPNY